MNKMVDIREIGKCEILGHDKFSITIVDNEGGIRYLDREDYPELAAECKYEKVVADRIKDFSLDVHEDEYVYVNVFDGFASRRISPVETRTKIEDYLITFESINGEAFIDDLNKEGNVHCSVDVGIQMLTTSLMWLQELKCTI
jgi:hypothetical protein